MQRIKRFKENKIRFQNPEYVKLNDICLKNYIWNRCILHKKEWKLVFKGKHIKRFSERVKEKVTYFLDALYFKFKGGETKYLKPIDLKTTNAPNELALERILNKVGLKIIDEKLLPCDTIYFICEK